MRPQIRQNFKLEKLEPHIITVQDLITNSNLNIRNIFSTNYITTEGDKVLGFYFLSKFRISELGRSFTNKQLSTKYHIDQNEQ